MSKHTPGPWKAHKPGPMNPHGDKSEWAITGGVSPDPFTQARYLSVATVHRTRSPNPMWRQDEEEAGNAALIAAAPDLLSACKAQDAHLQELDRLTRAIDLRYHPDARNLVAAMTAVIRLAIAEGPNNARAAIAKATGKA